MNIACVNVNDRKWDSMV